MNANNNLGLQTILDSEDGIHISIYLQNPGDLQLLKDQLDESLDTVEEALIGAMPPDSAYSYLAPIEQLLDDPHTLAEMRDNVGIFRTHNTFRVVNIPVDLQNIAVVATTFHVKPLLRWLQIDHKFHVIGLAHNSIRVYEIDRRRIELVDLVPFYDYKTAGSKAEPKDLRFSQAEVSLVNHWLNEIKGKHAGEHEPLVFIGGVREAVQRLMLNVEEPWVKPLFMEAPLTFDDLQNVVFKLRSRISKRQQNRVDELLHEVKTAPNPQRHLTSLKAIAKAAVAGNIQSLVVAQDLNVFGQLDKTTGEVKINPFHLDHEDDDLLDDLAQMVIKSGGTVLQTDRRNIPQGHVAVAIVNPRRGKSADTGSRPQLVALHAS